MDPDDRDRAIKALIDAMVQAGISQEDAEKVAPELIDQSQENT